ncbi:hypothetical protein EXIGLDRAFT_713182 [Exidia glandulosa HHB12029]|uniref:CBM1 domain-containing protein n=1 Tax=Exidia glandulosa HHB12029 TaxID=1314781 RepID=A0A166B6C1_EXIGL|nr:hypothetical protein EXIGLDRAFT_713182 [Exidia glandulosa HHB12029]
MLAFAVLSALAASSLVRADCAGNAGTQAVWAQCGGMGWTGATTCVNGASCVAQNPYYSQCLPCTATTTASSTTTKSSATVTATTTSASSTPSTPAGTSAIKQWFVFGDSYTQTGFNSTGTQPNAANPLGNPPFPGYTACGSVPNWIDYDVMSYNSSVKMLYNFAAGGATIDSTLVPPYMTGIPSLVEQVAQFMSGYTSNGKPGGQLSTWTGANSFVGIWIGINDIGNSYYNSGDRAAFNDVLLDRYFSQITALYTVGLRNFAFLNVPPVDRSPLVLLAQMLPQSGAATEKTVIADFNAKVKSRAAAFASSNSGAKTYVVDTNTLIGGLLDKPTANGFTDATTYGSQAGVMWCNNYHISPGVHDFVAKLVKTTLAGTGAP